MTGLSARRFVSACAVSAVAAVAALVLGAATASATTISGQGSTLQEFAQQKVFIPKFNEKSVTEGGEVKEYVGTGSGPGLEAWGNRESMLGEFNTWEYVGTDQPPNAKQKELIEKAAGGAVVESIPTLQAAVAIIIQLPEGCTSAMSGDSKAPNRLVLNNKTLEGIFAHTITKWSQIKEDGDELLPVGCEAASEKSNLITRVVREEGSGTTAITKKYFYQINSGVLSDGKTWNQLAEENKNLTWPEEGLDLVRGKGNPGVVAGVISHDGSIGYANLANAYEKFHGEGGTLFWAFVQHNGTVETGGKYENPEKPGKKVKVGKEKVVLEGTSNCKGDEYVNGVGAKFPPKTTSEAWNEVSATPKNKKYSLCGFTYDLSLHGFSMIEEATRPTEAQVALVKNYFNFMLTEGAALLAAGTDYEGLPTSSNPEKSVLDIAKKGVEEIDYTLP